MYFTTFMICLCVFVFVLCVHLCSSSTCFSVPDTLQMIYNTSCDKSLNAFIEDNLYIVGGVGIAFGLFEVRWNHWNRRGVGLLGKGCGCWRWGEVAGDGVRLLEMGWGCWGKGGVAGGRGEVARDGVGLLVGLLGLPEFTLWSCDLQSLAREVNVQAVMGVVVVVVISPDHWYCSGNSSHHLLLYHPEKQHWWIKLRNKIVISPLAHTDLMHVMFITGGGVVLERL